MSAPYSARAAFLIILASAAVIFAIRTLPFTVFARRRPPAFVRFIERYMPSLIMAALVVYCFKDVPAAPLYAALPYAAASALTVLLYLKTNNSMLTIFASTAAFIVLSRFLH